MKDRSAISPLTLGGALFFLLLSTQLTSAQYHRNWVYSQQSSIDHILPEPVAKKNYKFLSITATLIPTAKDSASRQEAEEEYDVYRTYIQAKVEFDQAGSPSYYLDSSDYYGYLNKRLPDWGLTYWRYEYNADAQLVRDKRFENSRKEREHRYKYNSRGLLKSRKNIVWSERKSKYGSWTWTYRYNKMKLIKRHAQGLIVSERHSYKKLNDSTYLHTVHNGILCANWYFLLKMDPNGRILEKFELTKAKAKRARNKEYAMPEGVPRNYYEYDEKGKLIREVQFWNVHGSETAWDHRSYQYDYNEKEQLIEKRTYSGWYNKSDLKDPVEDLKEIEGFVYDESGLLQERSFEPLFRKVKIIWKYNYH